ncbi:MAG: hypothetical protein ACOYYI_07795 [Chloroflexota bacterium]
MAAGTVEPFETSPATWIIETDVSGAGASVSTSSAQKHAGNYSAAAFTTNSNSKAQVRDVIPGAWSSVPADAPGSFIWQRAYVYVPSATANALTGSEYIDLAALYVSADASGFYLRLKASGALYASAPGNSGQTEFNLYGTFPLNQWVEVELGLWSRNTGDLDRAGAFLINGKFYGWFTNAQSGTNYDRAAMGIVSTNSADDLTVYIDDWYIYTTGTNPTGPDNRPTAAVFTKYFTDQSGENVGYHYTTWENGYRLDGTYGLSPSGRIQAGFETSKMPDLSDGWTQIVIDWANGQTPPWPPEGIGAYFGPMVAFRKSVELEENLEIVPVYRSSTGTVDLVYESWTLGPIEYASWQLPPDVNGRRLPGRGDIIRVRWQEVSTTQIRVRVDYYDASAGTWYLDVIDDTRVLTNVNGVNFLADTHRAVTNTIDSNDYTIKSQTVGTLATFGSVSSTTYTISGNTGVGGVSLSYVDGTAKTVTSAPDGSYSISVPSGWSGTVTPSLTGVTFTPASRTYTNVTSNFSAQDYTPSSFTLSGNAGASGVTLSYTDGTAKTATSAADGSYSLTVSYNWSGTVTPSHPCYTFTPASRTYTNVTANQTGQNYTATFNSSSGCANVNVNIGGAAMGNYGVPPGKEERLYYPVSGGPVKVESTNGVNLVSAIRLQSYANNTLYSFVETMGVPQGLLSYKYVFPTYNNTWAPLNSQIRVSNLETTPTTVRITIGSDVVWEQQMQGLEEQRLYFNASGGPVIVESLDTSKKIVAAIRLQSYANNLLYSFSETMGIPDQMLSYRYYFPTYNNTWAPLNSQIRVSNLETTPTTVRITIGSSVVWEREMQGREEQRLYFPVSGGPVIVESLDTSKKIVAAIRLQSYANNILYSFVETMGVPEGLLSHKYYFPTYNNTWTPLNSQIRVSNLETTPTTVRITIGGTAVWEQQMQGREEQRLYFNVSGGPVIVESLDTSKKIVAAIRLQSYANNTLYSFSETMGIPLEQMTNVFYFPTYNNTWAPLNSQLRFGVP